MFKRTYFGAGRSYKNEFDKGAKSVARKGREKKERIDALNVKKSVQKGKNVKLLQIVSKRFWE